MQYYRCFASALPYGHLNGSDYHLPILAVVHGPAHYQIAEQIQHHAQKELSFLSGDLRNVRNPLGIRFQCKEFPIQVILNTRRPMRYASPTPALLTGPSLNSVSSHKPRNPVQACYNAFGSQILMHARRANHAATVIVNLPDPQQ
tara:strand:- start:442 stop:876 length:435 start_codon:yes stop_codon:yes gene_type:complete